MSRFLTKQELLDLKAKNGTLGLKYIKWDHNPKSDKDDGYRQYLLDKAKKKEDKRLKRKRIRASKASAMLRNKQRLEKRLIKMSESLKKDTPKSELWFYNHYEAFTIETDSFNEPFKCFIPDIMNKQYKYIIEIDGSIHNTPEQIKKDARKDRFYTRHGFQVFRVVAYDTDSLRRAIDGVLNRRKDFDVVLRKVR